MCENGVDERESSQRTRMVLMNGKVFDKRESCRCLESEKSRKDRIETKSVHHTTGVCFNPLSHH